MTEADYLEAVAPLTDRGAPLEAVEANGLALCDLIREHGRAAFAEHIASTQDVFGLSESEAARFASALVVRFCPDLAD